MTTAQVENIETASPETAPKTLGVWELMASDIRAWLTLWQKFPSDARLPGRLALKYVWSHCGLRATLLYRISYALSESRIPLLPGVIRRWNITLHGFDVPSNVKIGPGLYVPHPVGTVITAKNIGANLTLVSGITIGMRNSGEFPTIGDGVFIGAGARVLGGIRIGDHANIGANAVVLTDVPAGATAVGVPAKIKAKKQEA